MSYEPQAISKQIPWITYQNLLMNDVEWHGNEDERLERVWIIDDVPPADSDQSDHEHPLAESWHSGLKECEIDA